MQGYSGSKVFSLTNQLQKTKLNIAIYPSLTAAIRHNNMKCYMQYVQSFIADIVQMHVIATYV